MKHTVYTLITLLLLIAMPALAGTDKVVREKYPEGKTFMYRLYLTDKHGTPATLTNPAAYLSKKALDRRKRQGLPIDSTDLPLSPIYTDKVKETGVMVVSQSKWNNTLLVRTHETTVLPRLEALPCVRNVKLVWTSPDSIEVRHPRPHYHDELETHDSAYTAYHGVTTEQLAMLGGTRVHNAGYQGQGITIAVLDGGFQNADLIPALRDINLVGYADFVVPQSKSIFSEMEHGTQVISAMAVNAPNTFVGSAPLASYWMLRCEDGQSEQMAEEDYWAAAAEFADSAGVDIINSSLGFHDFDAPSTSYRYAQQDGRTALISRTASMLAHKGIILVNSAGNDGMGTWKRINFPADATDIITVGAVTPGGRNAAFCSVGPTADGRIKPDVMAQGSPTAVVSGRGTITREVGTSFATPLIAGMVACLWQALPEKTALEIIDLVRHSGNNAACPDNVYGYGVPDFWKTLVENKTKK